jgi:hypothetical protein
MTLNTTMEHDLEKLSAPTQVALPSQLLSDSFGWRNVSYSVNTKTGKKDIKSVSGCVEKGIFQRSQMLMQALFSLSWAHLAVGKLRS